MHADGRQWAGGEHGFAAWFGGAPDRVDLAVTQFWHPCSAVCV